ncbi:unnamed protein product [Lactuca saligna]|uniref:Leucine-rich repeat-containing N-terminal plant-type domain-containing protein n=1 Tax=Lactuca saligna TaxID=75948 RepID=A0AA35YHG2_LACSI|nr:unnamed protein product [Lactuca saligna]
MRKPWLLFLLLIFATANFCLGCLEEERQALLQFKHSLAPKPSGGLSSWKGNKCCEWQGIGCDNATKHVTMLDLGSNISGSYMQLEGNELNSNLVELTHLSYMDLSGVHFRSIPIPDFIGSMTQLRYLYLYFAGFSGIIPHGIGNLSNLRELDLSGNQLTGSIPTSFGNLVMLRTLDLSLNLLNGPIPFSLGRLSNLEILYLNSNSLSEIPLSIGNLSRLQFLDLSKNLLQIPLPDTIGHLSKLEFLDISNTSLSGVITEAHFANTSMLKHLDARWNHMLSFTISPDWNPPFQIRNILLESCKIKSEFPSWIRMQRSLVILNLSNTSIFGALPDWLRDLPIIMILDLSHNFLSGPLTNLPSNQTTESFTIFPFTERLVGYGRGSSLLVLRNNLFNGSIPDSLCYATKIYVLDLSKNMLSGTLPDCIGDLPELNCIVLSSNRLSGVIPSSLGNLGSSLNWLQLNNNSFHGELPETLANCTGLDLLDLGQNQFSGSIPKWLGEKVMFIRVLRLHKNNFTGPIPVELCESSELQIMDLGDNNLTGKIPLCFQKLSGMTGGYSDMDFLGRFEQSLTQVMKGVALEYTTKIKYIVNMDLSSNKLVGEIPKELVLLAGLVGLNLSNNHLTGQIPDRIGDMKSLFSLDLSVNSLSGMIPQSMSALTSLSQLNLSHNRLSGQIPTGNQLQTLLDPSIYAANNQLCGSPLPTSCKHDRVLEVGRNTEEDEDDDDFEKMWIYGVTSGFTTGFMGILGILVLKNRWRHAFFNFVGGYIRKKL